MADILPPIGDGDDPDRRIRCQDALQHAFRDLMDAATSLGWREHEVAAALIDLAENHMRARQANEGTNTLFALLRRMT